MQVRHVFSFEGGEELTTMGASWFISYMWHDKLDQLHTNWKNVSTYLNRISVYNRTKHFHASWLLRIVSMSESSLNRNKLQLSGKKVIEMANILLTNL